MTPEERITNFHEALKADNQIWYDGLPCIFPNKDITVAIRKVWLIMHGEGKITRNMDWKEARSLVQRTLTWQEPKSTEGFEKAKPVEIHPQALTGEAREARIKEFLDVLAKVGNPPKQKTDPYKEVREQWKAPEGVTYHPPSPEETVLSDLKVEYGRLHTDKLTGKTLPDHPSFNEFIRDL